MSSVTVSLIFQAAILTAGSNEYEMAFKETYKTGKPLLVLVSAEWCPACRRMKQTTLPELSINGQLKDVVFATVDTDRQKTLAGKLMRSDTIPQLILFSKTSDGWKREQMIGRKDASEIQAFVARGVKRVAANKSKMTPR